MDSIYFTDSAGRNSGSLRVSGSLRDIADPVSLTVTYYDGADTMRGVFEVSMTVDQARRVAEFLLAAADRIAAKTELPANARVVEAGDELF